MMDRIFSVLLTVLMFLLMVSQERLLHAANDLIKHGGRPTYPVFHWRAYVMAAYMTGWLVRGLLTP